MIMSTFTSDLLERGPAPLKLPRRPQRAATLGATFETGLWVTRVSSINRLWDAGISQIVLVKQASRFWGYSPP